MKFRLSFSILNSLISILLYCYLASGTSYAQHKIMPGYIVTNQNDTIKGMIDDKDWDITPDTIYFGKEINSVNTKYSVNDIKAFGVDEKYYYISKYVTIDMAPNNTEQLKYVERYDSVRIDTVNKSIFLNVLVSGKLSLFFYRDFNGKEHFYAQKDKDTLVELILQRYLKQELSGIVQHTAEKYKYMLTFFMHNCDSVIDDIKKLKFKESDLIAIVTKYNKCFNGDLNFYIKPQVPTGVKFGIVGALSNTNLSFSGKFDLDGLNETKFNSYTMADIGLFISIPVGKKFHRHQMNFDLLLKPINISSSYTNINYSNGTNTTSNTTYNFNLLYLKLSPQYRYVYLRTDNNFDCFFNLGCSISYALSDDNNYVGTNNFYGTITKQKGELFTGKSFEFAFIAGLGTTINNFTIELRAERGNGMVIAQDFSSTFMSFYLLVGYSF